MKIERAENGYVLTKMAEEGYVERFIYEQLTDLLHAIKDYYDDGSRYDEKRIYIIEAPGDKHPNFSDKHYDLIWGDK